MDEKQKPLGTKLSTKSGFEMREEFSNFFHTAARELDVEESKFDIIAEQLFHLFLCDFGGFYIYFPKAESQVNDDKWNVYYREYKAENYSVAQIANIKGCGKRAVFERFRRIARYESLTESERRDARSPTEKQRILDGGIGTGRSKTTVRKFADFFNSAVRQLDIEESKFDASARKLLKFLLLNFGGQYFYVPALKRNEYEERWQECFMKYRRGIFSIEKIAKLMQVTQRHVYRKLKEMTERERQARRQAAEAAPPSFRGK